MKTVRLIGLDFGTTTSSGLFASARLSDNAVTGKRELTDIQESFRSEVVFTPFTDDGLDESKLQGYLDGWLAAGCSSTGDPPEEVFGGGALVTGLAARQKNSASLVRLVRSRLGNSLVATADDPCFEAWLAFQASAAEISRAHPNRWVINLDIGGGTTDLALAKGGNVLRTGSLFVGARHIQVVPGTYRMTKVSAFAEALLGHRGIAKHAGDSLDPADVAAIAGFYLDLLSAAVTGDTAVFDSPAALVHRQVPFELPAGVESPIVTLSGGVGELVYAISAESNRGNLPSTTYFGDLGIDLAAHLAELFPARADFKTFVPRHAGRATMYGLLRHAVQLSGSTVYLPKPEVLPLSDLPILGRIAPSSTGEQIRDILVLVQKSPRGGCVQVDTERFGLGSVTAFGEKIARILQAIQFSPAHPLVFVLFENVGKVLGNFISRWGSLPLNLVVLDEIEVRDARFVQIGRMHDQIVPVSFYGMN